MPYVINNFSFPVRINNSNFRAFSIIELSVVLLVIGLMVAGITNGSIFYGKFKLSGAANLTNGASFRSMPGLIFWVESTSEKSFAYGTTSFVDLETPENNQAIGMWNPINPQRATAYASQATSNYQPLYVANAINGLPALLFDGVDDFFSISDTKLFAGLGSYTTFVVFSSNIVTNGLYNLIRSEWGAISRISGNGSAIKCARYAMNSNNTWVGSDNPVGAPSIEAFKPTFCTSIYNGSNLMGYTNGANPDTADAISGNIINSITSLSIGSLAGTSEFFSGYIGEIIIFNRDLTSDELDEVHSYLKQKWGIK